LDFPISSPMYLFHTNLLTIIGIDFLVWLVWLVCTMVSLGSVSWASWASCKELLSMILKSDLSLSISFVKFAIIIFCLLSTVDWFLSASFFVLQFL